MPEDGRQGNRAFKNHVSKIKSALQPVLSLTGFKIRLLKLCLFPFLFLKSNFVHKTGSSLNNFLSLLSNSSNVVFKCFLN